MAAHSSSVSHQWGLPDARRKREHGLKHLLWTGDTLGAVTTAAVATAVSTACLCHCRHATAVAGAAAAAIGASAVGVAVNVLLML